MRIDLPYLTFRALVRPGLAGIPLARRVRPDEVTIGTIVDGARITFFSAMVGGGPSAACTIVADGDAIASENGAMRIDLGSSRKNARTKDVGLNKSFTRTWLVDRFCPPLVAGYNAAKMRIRLYTEPDDSREGPVGQHGLRVELYGPDTPNRLLSLRFAAAPLEARNAPGQAERVLVLKASFLRRLSNCLGLCKIRGANVDIVSARGYCALVVRDACLSSVIDMVPGDYEAHREFARVSFGARDFASAVEDHAGADMEICRFAETQDRGGMVRLAAPGWYRDCDCVWDGDPGAGREPDLAAPHTRPLVLPRDMLCRAVRAVCRGADNIWLRLHHRSAQVTVVGEKTRKGNSRKPESREILTMVAMDSGLPPSAGGISSWRVSKAHLQKVTQSMSGPKICVYPADGALVLVDPGEPFVGHRLNCEPIEALDQENARKLLEMEAGLA